ATCTFCGVVITGSGRSAVSHALTGTVDPSVIDADSEPESTSPQPRVARTPVPVVVCTSSAGNVTWVPVVAATRPASSIAPSVTTLTGPTLNEVPGWSSS